jgi:hypothetical protein
VFFDAINFRKVYEPEGFELKNGVKYLPDFYLPDWKYFVEVKGFNEHLVEDILKVKQFVRESKASVIIINDMPYDPDAKGLFWFPIINYTSRSGGALECNYAFFEAYEKWDGGIGICLQDDFAVGMRHYWHVDEKNTNEQASKAIAPISGAVLDEYDSITIKDSFPLHVIETAFIKARKARFEHGETPNT